MTWAQRERERQELELEQGLEAARRYVERPAPIHSSSAEAELVAYAELVHAELELEPSVGAEHGANVRRRRETAPATHPAILSPPTGFDLYLAAKYGEPRWRPSWRPGGVLEGIVTYVAVLALIKALLGNPSFPADLARALKAVLPDDPQR